MSLIFDSFPSVENATDFMAEVFKKFKLSGMIHLTAEQAYAADPTPASLYPPVVHIPRASQHVERQVEKLVKDYDGAFVGT